MLSYASRWLTWLVFVIVLPALLVYRRAEWAPEAAQPGGSH